MESPYRDRLGPAPLEEPRSRGIVDEVISQFADRFAFLRELVQNAIDAGTPEIEVEVAHEQESGVARVSVRDRGEGMDRELIEGSLLVLFRSTKDRDPSKIGKFGVGFASVLATNPRLVIVDTARGGQRWIVHLFPDLRYEIFEQGPSMRMGTTVELEVPVEDGDGAAFAQRCREALLRWCEHAEVPITLRHAEGASEREERIDRPADIPGALAVVRGVSEDRHTAAIVGLLPQRQGYSAFYNRGLLLHVARHAIASGIAFKVVDQRLGHTLSRDDVRRDAAYEQVRALVDHLAEKSLPEAVARELAATAAITDERWGALFDAADDADLGLAAAQWHLPRLGADGQRFAIAAPELPRRTWASRDAGPVARALAGAGVAVLAPPVAARAPAIERRARRELRLVENELTLVTLVTAEHAQVLLSAMSELLARVTKSVPALALTDHVGAAAAWPWLAGSAGGALAVIDAQRWIVNHQVAAANPFEHRSYTLCLPQHGPAVRAALRLAAKAPRQAAALLARAILLHYGKLDEETSLALARCSLAEVVAAGQEPA